MENIERSTLKGILKKVGIGALAMVALVDVGVISGVVVDIVNSKKGNDIGLLTSGAHLKEGNHNFIITDQFYDSIKDEEKSDQNLIIDSFKQAYKTLNELNSEKIRFTLCTTSSDASREFNLPLISSYSKYDVPLYVENGIIDGNKLTSGATRYETEMYTYYMKNESIIFKKGSLLGVYSVFVEPEEFYSYKNSYAYTICAHETMHVMGFKHRDKDSILYPYIPSPYRDFTDYDKKLLVEYNKTFYNALPEYAKKSQQTNAKTQSECVYTVDIFNDFCH